MRMYYVRNRILQRLYRPGAARSRFLSEGTKASLSEIDQLIEEKITPLLSSLLRD